MILAKDLIYLLKEFPPNTEIVVYQGQRSGLHCSFPPDEPLGWIDIEGHTKQVTIDSLHHVIPHEKTTE